MPIIRNAILAGALTVFVPWTGLAPQLSELAHHAKSRLADLVHTTTQEAGRDFQVNGVRIHAEPSSPSTVVGLGNPGEHADVGESVAGNLVTCPHGEATTGWVRVTDRETGVSGYVADCYV